MAAHIAVRPHLFLYAGQDMPPKLAWYGAREARGVADAYASVTALNEGDEDERIPLWDIVRKKIVSGNGEWIGVEWGFPFFERVAGGIARARGRGGEESFFVAEVLVS